MRENRIKKAIREGGVAIGTTLGAFATRETARILDYTGLDWVMVDMEHSGFTIGDVANLMQWFESTNITPIVRPPDNLYHLIAPLLDVGAMGVQCAKIESAKDAQGIVDSVMYPPLGNRGVSMTGGHTGWGRPKSGEYMPLKNAETTIVAMIESPKGLQNIDEIAQVEGIDVIQASHHDLSVSLGIPGQYEHPKYKEALATVAAACRKHGKALKVNPHTEQDLNEFYALGYRVLGVRNAIIAFEDALKGDVDLMKQRIAKLAAKG